jgi:hypothetical protein
MLTVIYAECHIEAPYAECRYAECRGTQILDLGENEKNHSKFSVLKNLQFNISYRVNHF